jgi:diacylglycerol kinase family enzyme
VLVVMNAEFLGSWDVAPRGHPNDGRAEVFEAGKDLTLRQRLAARKRLRTATHIPHPAIATRSIRQASWDFAKPMAITVDGRRCGRHTRIDVVVTPDAAILHV